MPHDKGKFLILDIDSGDYEVDDDDSKATQHELLPARTAASAKSNAHCRCTVTRQCSMPN